MKTPWAALLLACAPLASPALADRSEDDLAAVKKAVATSPAPVKARAIAEDPADVRPSERKGEPQWFRVRIVEKAGKRAKVSVNLPLALVRALGEDWKIHDCHRCERRGLTLGDVLRSLDAGQSLVEVDDEEATVRVWLE